MHLRMSDATANKALALSHIQHPLAPEPWQPREHDGSRRCLLSPNASSAPSAPSSPRIGTAHSASPRGRRDARSAGAASARTGSLLEAADRPAAAGGDGGGGDGRVISARGLGGSEGIGAARPHHHILEDIYLPPPTPPPRVRVTGQVIRRGPLYGDPGVSNEAVEAMFGKRPPEYGRAIPPDAINMHTIQQIDTSYKRAGSQSARPRRPIPQPVEEYDDPHAVREEEELSDEQAAEAWKRSQALNPYRRVEERIRLLRKSEHLRRLVTSRAQEHARQKAAALTVDFLQKNADPTNFTPESNFMRRREAKVAQANRRHEKRSAYALSVARSPERPTGGGPSSELLMRVRQFRRLNDLRRGLRALAGAMDDKRAQRWLMLVHLAQATSTIHTLVKLAPIVQRIRTSSRTLSAVRTLQRRFREKKDAQFNQRYLVHVTRIQRRMRYWLARRERQRRGHAVSVLVNYLHACERLSPMEMAMHRYILRVRILQRFVRGSQAITRSKVALLTLQWRRLEQAKLVALHAGGGRSRRSSHDSTQAPELHRSASGKLHVDKHGIVVRGQYAGVPEEMLDVPLPHVPEHVRTERLKRILEEMRRLAMQESIAWDQKVLLAAERHPALIKGDRGLQRLAVIQHDLQKDQTRGKAATERYASVLAIMDHMSVSSESAPAKRGRARRASWEGPEPTRRASVKNSMMGQLKKLSETLAEQREALEEIRRSIPRPFQRILAPADMMRAAFEECYQRCKDKKTLEPRPIRAQPPHLTRKATSGIKLPDQV